MLGKKSINRRYLDFTKQGVESKLDKSMQNLTNFKLISSPLVRTVQTSLEITEVLGIKDIAKFAMMKYFIFKNI